MSAPTVERVTDFACALGESPVWRAAEGALYWVDITKRLVRRLVIDSGVAECWRTEEMVACIAFDRHGGLIAGMESGIFALTFTPEGLLGAERLAAPKFPMSDMRFNDGRCDRQGRFWAGTMHMDTKAGNPVGALYRYDGARGLVGPVQDGLRIQNGIGFSPSGDRMYLSDSNRDACVIWCFDYDIATGMPSNRRVFVDMKQHRGRPDGAAVDEDGCYWTCASDGACLLRFTPDGVLDRSVELPVSKPTMCAFGGSGYETLFVTSMQPAPGLPRAEDGSDGAVFALRPGVRGLPETDFAG